MYTLHVKLSTLYDSIPCSVCVESETAQMGHHAAYRNTGRRLAPLPSSPDTRQQWWPGTSVAVGDQTSTAQAVSGTDPAHHSYPPHSVSETQWDSIHVMFSFQSLRTVNRFFTHTRKFIFKGKSGRFVVT